MRAHGTYYTFLHECMLHTLTVYCTRGVTTFLKMYCKLIVEFDTVPAEFEVLKSEQPIAYLTQSTNAL